MVFSHLASAAALLFSLLVWVFPTQADTSGPQCAQSFATFKDLKTLDQWDHWIYWQRRLSRYELDSNQKEELVHLQVNLARGHNKSANTMYKSFMITVASEVEASLKQRYLQKK